MTDEEAKLDGKVPEQFGMTQNFHESDDKLLSRLRRSCRTSFEQYMDAAGKSAGQLARVSGETFDPLSRVNLSLLCRKEDKALETYLRARAALLEHLFESHTASVAGGR